MIYRDPKMELSNRTSTDKRTDRCTLQSAHLPHFVVDKNLPGISVLATLSPCIAGILKPERFPG